jgi:hypothetical protein
MQGREDGYNSYVSMTLISIKSKENISKWLMHLVGECMNCMVQPLVYQNNLKCIISKAAKAYLQYMEMVTKFQQGKCSRRLKIINWEMMKLSYIGTQFMYPILMN